MHSQALGVRALDTTDHIEKIMRMCHKLDRLFHLTDANLAANMCSRGMSDFYSYRYAHLHSILVSYGRSA